MIKQPLNIRGYPDPPTRPQIAKWVADGWSMVTDTVIMRCAIRCGVTRVSDYSPEIVRKHELDKVKISPVIADLVAGDTSTTEEAIFEAAAESISDESWMQEMSSVMGIQLDNELERELLLDL